MSDIGFQKIQKKGDTIDLHYVVAERTGAHVIIMEIDAETTEAAEVKARALLEATGLKKKGSDCVNAAIVYDGFVSSHDSGPQVIGCLPARPLDREGLQDSVPHSTLRLNQDDVAVIQSALTMLLQHRHADRQEDHDRILGLLCQLERPTCSILKIEVSDSERSSGNLQPSY